MKKLYKCFPFLLLLLSSCVKDDAPEIAGGKARFTIEEARVFYEGRAWDRMFSRSGGEEVVTLWPGAMNPDWEAGTTASNGEYDYVYVPIPNGYRFAIKRDSIFTEASQLLSMVKRREDGRIEASVVTLLPTEEYRKAYGDGVAQQFLYFDDYFNYSGLVMYHTLDELAFIGVGWYENGERVAYYSCTYANSYGMLEAAVSDYLDEASVWRYDPTASRWINDNNWIEVVVVTTPPSGGGGDEDGGYDIEQEDPWGLLDIGGGGPADGGADNGGASGGNTTYSNPTVRVDDGLCVIGSIAAAIQVKFGVDPATAISQATAALQAAGITTTPVNGGINVDGAQITQVLTSLGFNVANFVHTAGNIQSHFDDGGFGIGFFNGTPAHQVLLTGYNTTTNTCTYYDAVTGGNHTGTPNDAIFYFN